jgi:hypothetical protein
MDNLVFVGPIVGSILILGTPILIVAIFIITMVVCVCNKRCPLYSQRQSRRRQPQVGVLVTVDCQQDDNAKNESIKYHTIDHETPQGIRDPIALILYSCTCIQNAIGS